RDNAEPEMGAREHDGRAGGSEVWTSSHTGDPGRFEVHDRFEQRVFAVVERVIVRERHAVDTKIDERVDRDRWRAEVKRFSGHRAAAFGDAALEIRQAEVRFRDGLDDL